MLVTADLGREPFLQLPFQSGVQRKVVLLLRCRVPRLGAGCLSLARAAMLRWAPQVPSRARQGLTMRVGEVGMRAGAPVFVSFSSASLGGPSASMSCSTTWLQPLVVRENGVATGGSMRCGGPAHDQMQQPSATRTVFA